MTSGNKDRPGLLLPLPQALAECAAQAINRASSFTRAPVVCSTGAKVGDSDLSVLVVVVVGDAYVLDMIEAVRALHGKHSGVLTERGRPLDRKEPPNLCKSCGSPMTNKPGDLHRDCGGDCHACVCKAEGWAP